MYLIVGLGNPGNEYKETRHNVGFDAVDLLGKRNFIDINKVKFNAVYGEGNIFGKKVFLIKPTTYMNLSGQAIKEFADYYKVQSKNIIVIADDIDIPFSSIRIRRNGSGGSHNGLKSVVNSLNTREFPRIKIGVGQKNPKQSLVSFVMGKFSKDERIDIDSAIEISAKATEIIIKDGIDVAMNEYNNHISKAQD